jgi:hypothetical protein
LSQLLSFTISSDDIKNSFTKFPAHLFREYGESGALYHILKTCFEFKSESGWQSFDFNSNAVSGVNLLERISNTLVDHGFIVVKRIFIETQDVRQFESVLSVIKKLGRAEFVADSLSATHIVSETPDYLKENEVSIAARTYETENGRKYAHFLYQPDSNDQLLDNNISSNVDVDTVTPKSVWHVYSRYITDSAKFGEWMNEHDYDLDAFNSESAYQTAIEHGIQRRKQFDKKRSAEDAELDGTGDESSKKQKVDHNGAEQHPLLRSVILPSHTSWFDMDTVHDIEKRALPEFFDGKNPQKTPEMYLKYRNFMINTYRKDLGIYLTATECRKFLTGDVCSIMRIHQFLEHWGLINYGVDPRNRPFSLNSLSSSQPVDTVYQDYTKSDPSGPPTEKLIMFNQNPTPHHHNRSNIPQAPGTQISDWSDEETLRLLEGVSKFKDNWTQVAQFVRTRSKEECVLHFAQLPIEDNFLLESDGAINSAVNKSDPRNIMEQPLPFADASNPIMSVVAFLSSMVNPSVASAAAQAALEAMNKENNLKEQIDDQMAVKELNIKGTSAVAIGAAAARAKKIVEHEEREIQRLVAFVIEKQLKKLEVKIKHFERLEEAMVKEKEELKKAQRDLYEEKKSFMPPQQQQ